MSVTAEDQSTSYLSNETPPYNKITVSPIAGSLGAEIHGVDLSQDLDEETFGEIRRALLENNVIFFRDQDLQPDSYLKFARRWGSIHRHPYVKPLEGYPDILELLKTEKDTRTFGSNWHTDQAFCEKPAMATMLYALEVPDAGGDTCYANMTAAYEALSDGMKEMLQGLKGVNDGDNKKKYGGKSRAERYVGISSQTAIDPGELQTVSVHPIVRTHPETGRKSLYISSHTKQFEGMTEEESEPLLNYLAKHIQRPEFSCRFRWQPGSLAIWDNRCSQHKALGDYDGKLRRMYRITIEGDVPF